MNDFFFAQNRNNKFPKSNHTVLEMSHSALNPIIGIWKGVTLGIKQYQI